MRLNARQAATRAQQLMQAARFREALDITRQLAAAFPDAPALALMHAETLTRLHRSREALTTLDHALTLALSPDHAAHAWSLKAHNHAQLADPTRAQAALTHARALKPADPLLARALADLLIDQDQLDDAATTLAPLTNDPAAAPAFARLALRRKDPAQAIAHLQPLAAAHPDRPAPWFALAQCLEEAARYDEAFDAYTHANRAMNVRPDPAAHARRAEAATAACQALGPVPSTAVSPTVVLIVGMPRSGTSLVEQIFAAHPDAGACGESQALPALWRTVCRDPANPFTPSVDNAALEHAGRAYVEELRATATRVGTSVLTDKNPMNLFLLPVAARALAGVASLRIVRVRRSPMDVCVSCYTSPLGPDHDYACDLAACAGFYAGSERVLEAASRSLAPLVHEVRYEQLVREPESCVRAMLDHACLEYRAQCLSPERTGRAVRTISRDQVTGSINDRSVGRWRRFGDKLAPLREALRREGVGAEGDD